MTTVSGDSRHAVSQQDSFGTLLYILLVCAAAQSLWIFLRGFNFPILDLHGFRQTQTALSAYWLDRGGPPFIYETPVLGAPWAIPFEFPFYQWIVVGLRKLTGAPLDGCGRAVSYAFFQLTFIPLRTVVAYFYKEREAFLIAAILLLCSPLYLFWSRAFMIESTALFACVGFIACVIGWVRAPSALGLFAATLFAAFAALQKVTTFVPAAFVAGAIVLDAILRRAQDEPGQGGAVRKLVRAALAHAPIALPVVVSLALLTYWLKRADEAKALNSIGEMLTSSTLSAFNYGTWAQRTSGAFWSVVKGRMLPEAVGAPALLIAVASAALALNPGWARRAALIGAGFLAGLLVFANLHFIHNYYQYAISLYLILAVAFAVHEIGLQRPLLGAAALIALIASLSVTFYGGRESYFRALLSGDRLRNGQTLQLARYVAANTPPDSVVIGFGFDWSSELPYYAQRKGLIVPVWVGDDRLKTLLANPTQPIGGLPVGAIVICPPGLSADQKAELDANAEFRRALAGMTKTTIMACEVYRP